eukprot:2011401-Rhodomonas_salina.2
MRWEECTEETALDSSVAALPQRRLQSSCTTALQPFTSFRQVRRILGDHVEAREACERLQRLSALHEQAVSAPTLPPSAHTSQSRSLLPSSSASGSSQAPLQAPGQSARSSLPTASLVESLSLQTGSLSPENTTTESESANAPTGFSSTSHINYKILLAVQFTHMQATAALPCDLQRLNMSCNHLGDRLGSERRSTPASGPNGGNTPRLHGAPPR